MKLGGDREEELGGMDCLIKTHMHINNKREKGKKEGKGERQREKVEDN